MAKRKRKFKNEDEVFRGKEPSFENLNITPDNYQNQLTTFLNWYSEVPLKTRKGWYIKWGKEQGYSGIENIPPTSVFTVASLARMDSKGFPLALKEREYLKNKTNELLTSFATAGKSKDDEEAELIKLHKKEAIDELIGGVYQIIDDVIDKQLETGLKQDTPEINCEGLNINQIKEIQDYYNNANNEVKLARHKEDEALIEAYSYLNAYKMDCLIDLYQRVSFELENKISLIRMIKPRKPRRKKIKSPEEQTNKVKYLKSHEDYGIISLHPSKLIGSSVAYIFNTKNRKLQKYIIHKSGFTVKGTTLCEFNLEESYQKTIRKPKEFFINFSDAPKARASKLLEDVKATKGKVTGRINEHCVIIGVH